MQRTDYKVQCTLQAPNPNPLSGHQLIKPASDYNVGQSSEDKHAECYYFIEQKCIFCFSSAGIPSKFTKMIPNGYLIFEDESFLDSTVAKMNALRKSGQFCDVRLQV